MAAGTAASAVMHHPPLAAVSTAIAFRRSQPHGGFDWGGTSASSYGKMLPTSPRHRTTNGGSVSPQKAAAAYLRGGGGPL